MWIFRAEFGSSKKFTDWYNSRQPTKEEGELFEKFTELRNTTTHVKPVVPVWYVGATFTIPKDFNHVALKDKKMIIRISKVDKDGNQELTFTSDDGRELVGTISDYKILTGLGENEDLYSSCKRYLIVLKEIYKEWLSVNS